ncbi:endolytic transglycosylase MltG [Alkalilimnicola ehrlichii]|uniref:endolytic transglycosylase MltG n=1 Tax=Alkalilimnicola ehrlichii TaxID=351052 RepID=UPI002868D0A5|nr:endolytic transglycosylase MltG [Alkalilimnicola ehrlichii]
MLVVAMLAVGGWLYWDYQHTIERPLVLSDQTVHVQVERGTSFQQLTRNLAAQGLLEPSEWYRVWGRLSEGAGRIQAGEYAVTPGMSLPELVEKMARGDVVQYSFTIVEGWTFWQLMNALQAHPHIESELKGLTPEEVGERVGLDTAYPEGKFYPDTYRFPSGTTDVQFLRRANERLKAVLETEWERRAEELPVNTPYEALILASIIERETGQPHERGKVAGVFTRRLQIGMRLQTDPTVIYGLGEGFEGRLRTVHLRTDTPYNTYTRGGLPPTPIAMPSGASIRAALNPEDGTELYFVSRGDGTHHFSNTLREHNRAVCIYILKRSNCGEL